MTITLSAIHIYPVKSLRGISLPAAHTTSRGLRHDRRFMLVDGEGEFISQREAPQMATIATAIDGEQLRLGSVFGDSILVPLEPEPGPTGKVRVWSSNVDAQPVSADANAWLSDHLGIDARLVYMPDSTRRAVSPDHAGTDQIVSFADGFPLLLAATASLDELNRRIVQAGGEAVSMDRFRPNLVVSGSAPFAEDGWDAFRFGEVVLRGVKPCTRCQITTTDQASGEVRGPEPLRTLATFRNSPEGVRYGINLLTLAQGELRVGEVLQA
jgi:uncharacterized protein YcbX